MKEIIEYVFLADLLATAVEVAAGYVLSTEVITYQILFKGFVYVFLLNLLEIVAIIIVGVPLALLAYGAFCLIIGTLYRVECWWKEKQNENSD